MTTVAEADTVLNLSDFDPLWDDVALFKFIDKNLEQRPDDISRYLVRFAEFCDKQADKERGQPNGQAMYWSDLADQLWKVVGE